MGWRYKSHLNVIVVNTFLHFFRWSGVSFMHQSTRFLQLGILSMVMLVFFWPFGEDIWLNHDKLMSWLQLWWNKDCWLRKVWMLKLRAELAHGTFYLFSEFLVPVRQQICFCLKTFPHKCLPSSEDCFLRLILVFLEQELRLYNKLSWSQRGKVGRFYFHIHQPYLGIEEERKAWKLGDMGGRWEERTSERRFHLCLFFPLVFEAFCVI